MIGEGVIDHGTGAFHTCRKCNGTGKSATREGVSVPRNVAERFLLEPDAYGAEMRGVLYAALKGAS